MGGFVWMGAYIPALLKLVALYEAQFLGLNLLGFGVLAVKDWADWCGEGTGRMKGRRV
jgi:hypothetical protein